MAGIGAVNIEKIDANMVGSIFTGLGTLAKDIRAAISGQAVIDPTKQAELLGKLQEFEAKLEEGKQAAQNGQIEINKIDASSGKWWQAGWRPFIGWICGLSIGCYFIPQAVVGAAIWVKACAAAGWTVVPYPQTFDFSQLVVLTLNLLGLGYLRTQDKKSTLEKLLGG